MTQEGVATLQKSIDENYGEPDSVFAKADVVRVSEASVRACLKHPHGATLSGSEASRLENDDIKPGSVAWTCTGLLSSPLEFGEGMTRWTVAVVLIDKKEKTWKPVFVQIGDTRYEIQETATTQTPPPRPLP
jgi:hypothetical protein